MASKSVWDAALAPRMPAWPTSLTSSPSCSDPLIISPDAPPSWRSVIWDREIENKYKLNNRPHTSEANQKLQDRTGPEIWRHPRRTRRFHQEDALGGDSAKLTVLPPPPLLRQCERKENFVDSLVGKLLHSSFQKWERYLLVTPKETTTQMIETIWPLSILSCGRGIVSGKDRNLIDLRTFVQEVLRRSKTSYSTLQVALYYLFLIQSCIPKHDFTMEQVEDSLSCRAMQCGRRMFLAALILASKYLQDRNFSSRAWSKISGLSTSEIHTNEMAFLLAVNWKLHIPMEVFARWTDVVLMLSEPTSVNSSSPNRWKTIIPHLTADLVEKSPFGGATVFNDSGYSSPIEEVQSPIASAPPLHPRPAYPECKERTAVNLHAISSRSLKPALHGNEMNSQTLPPLPRLGWLPTPTMTPQTGTFCAPAVSAFGSCSGRSSMSIAMTQVHNDSLARSTLDNPNFWKPILPEPFPTSARRSSLARSSSSVSSPESMISDVSTRSSRSSSISSVASSTCALSQTRLAVQATRRCANLKLKEIRRPFIRLSPSEGVPWEGLSASPSAVPAPETYCFVHLSKLKPGVNTESPSDVGRTQSVSSHEAAAALHDLALDRNQVLPCPSALWKREPTSVDSYAGGDVEDSVINRSCGRYPASRKRERPVSTDFSLEATVRELIGPRPLVDITNNRRGSEDDGKILPDSRIADSFMVAKNCAVTSFDNVLGGTISPRKRACYADITKEEALRININDEEAQRISSLMMERAARPGPGMWGNII